MRMGMEYCILIQLMRQHLNVEGAEKLSLYLGEQLVKNFRLTDHRQDESYKNAWQTIVNKYYEEKQGD